MIHIGDRLREEREKQGYSLEDVAKATKIRLQFLRGIEEGNYKGLPSSAYIQGFVKNYIEFLHLPQKPWLALFRREFDEQEYRGVLPENLTAKKEISLNRVRIRQVIVLGGAIIIGLLIYIFIQYRQAFFSPGLSIQSPQDHAVINDQTVTITGNTDANASVTINNTPVFVDPSGNFTKEIDVFSGNSTITIKSTNTFGKTSTIEREILVK
jgi:cytoskeletal protein RodZ